VMARRLALTAALLVLFAGVGAGNAAAACTTPVKSTGYEPSNANAAFPVDDTQWVAQSFSVSSAGQLSKLSLDLEQADGGMDSITVQIRSDAGDSPAATILATRTAIYPSTSPQFADFDFSSAGIQLAAGTTYWIVATNDQSVMTGYEWEANNTSPTYADGHAATSPNHGSNWGAQDYDLLFQVWTQTCTADVQPPITPGPPALASVSGLGASPNVFAAASSGPSATLTKRRPVGTTVSYTLNEAASVKFTIKRRAKGRRVKRGKRKVCVKPTRKNRKKHRCSRFVRVKGSFSLNGVAGKNSFHFTGRLSGRKLSPGRYKLVATPTAAGKAGRPISTGFRIVR
jgi:hypothetical protein